MCYEIFSVPSYCRAFEKHAVNVGVTAFHLISHSVGFVLDEGATWTADVCQ